MKLTLAEPKYLKDSISIISDLVTFAIFIGPTGSGEHPVAFSERSNPAAAVAEAGGDRLPLARQIRLNGLRVGNPRQQQVSGMSLTPGAESRLGLDRSWSGGNLQDLQTISRLKLENRQLANALLQAQLQIRMRQAQLDTSGSKPLDLKE